MIFDNPYWSNQTRLDLLARWLIVHSIIYYELGTSIVPDSMWDNNARQYMDILYESPGLLTKIRWQHIMYDFDGTTGFHLFGRLNRKEKKRLYDIAWNLVHKI